jgi:hypothetical protein
MTHRREFAPFVNSNVIAERDSGGVVFFDSAHHRAMLTIEGVEQGVEWYGVLEPQRKSRRIDRAALCIVRRANQYFRFDPVEEKKATVTAAIFPRRARRLSGPESDTRRV